MGGGGRGWEGVGGGGRGQGGGVGEMVRGRIDHRKSTLARGSRWDYTSLPF